MEPDKKVLENQAPTNEFLLETWNKTLLEIRLDISFLDAIVQSKIKEWLTQ